MVTQSAANQIQILVSHTTSSPLSVPLSSVGVNVVVTMIVTNVGTSRFLVRGKAGAGTSGWTSLAEGEQANVVVESLTTTDAVSLEFARIGAEPRFISMYDTVVQDIPGQAKVERFD